MVIVAVSVPLPVQNPLVVMETGRPELAAAVTLKLAPLAAEDGADVVTVIVWFAFAALTF